MALLLEVLGAVALLTWILVLVAVLALLAYVGLDRLTQRWGPRARWAARRRRGEILDAASRIVEDV